jgi:hypothetical protein
MIKFSSTSNFRQEITMNSDDQISSVVSEAALASLILPNLINPVLQKMEKDDAVILAHSNIRNILNKIDNLYPTFCYDFMNEIYKSQQQLKSPSNDKSSSSSSSSSSSMNMNEIILRSERFSKSDG